MSVESTCITTMEPVIQYLPQYRVLLCTACPKTTCIPPKGIATHLRTFHKHMFTCEQRTRLATDARKYPAVSPRMVVTPRRDEGSVPGLYVQDGFECTVCNYVCGSEEYMRDKHCRPRHGWVVSKPQIWEPQSIQVNNLYPCQVSF
jgi:Orsellinic acid/F9775 biosynthesis cluster protein D